MLMLQRPSFKKVIDQWIPFQVACFHFWKNRSKCLPWINVESISAVRKSKEWFLGLTSWFPHPLSFDTHVAAMVSFQHRFSQVWTSWTAAGSASRVMPLGPIGEMKLTSKPSLIHWCLLTEWRALALVIDCSYWSQIDEGGGRRQRRRQQLPHELDCVCFVKRNAADPDLSQDLVFLCFSIILDASASWLDLTAPVVMPKPL